MWSAIKSLIAFVIWLRRFAKEINSNAEARLSQDAALNDRKALEGLALDMIEGKGNHWAHRVLRWVGLDDNAGVYLQTLLKSGKINTIRNGGSPLDKETARNALAEARAKFSGGHQP